MKNYEYVTKVQANPIKKELITIIGLVQKEVRSEFTFSYQFIGSSKRNMITYDPKSNVGYDFDVNIIVNDYNNRYSPKKIRNILKNAFDKYVKDFCYDYGEDRKRVITIKVKDKINSKILYSCDFAVVNDYIDNNGNKCQKIIFYNKKQNKYVWQEQPRGFYDINQKIDWCKENNLWKEVRSLYIIKKNTNTDNSKKSRSIFAETVNIICQRYGYYDD